MHLREGGNADNIMWWVQKKASIIIKEGESKLANSMATEEGSEVT